MMVNILNCLRYGYPKDDGGYLKLLGSGYPENDGGYIELFSVWIS